LLSQLAAVWNEQRDTIAELFILPVIVLSVIVFDDATGGKVGKRPYGLWIVSTTGRSDLYHRVGDDFRFGLRCGWLVDGSGNFGLLIRIILVDEDAVAV